MAWKYGSRRLRPAVKPCGACGKTTRFPSQHCRTCDTCQRAGDERRGRRRQRHAISPRQRRRIEARFLGCFYCGEGPGAAPEIDHVVPLDQGGTSADGNLVLACRSCNRSKGSKAVVEFVRHCLSSPTWAKVV